MMSTVHQIGAACLDALGQPVALLDSVAFVGEGGLPSVFAVTDLASAGFAVAGLGIAGLLERLQGRSPTIRVDRRLASYWYQFSIRPIGWEMPGPWDPIAGDYECRDGWIRLHTNAPMHRAAAERVLAQADVLLHGYRNGALEALGFDAATRRAIAPHLVDVSLDAYGGTGPWAGRRGFDSLVRAIRPLGGAVLVRGLPRRPPAENRCP